MLKHADAG